MQNQGAGQIPAARRAREERSPHRGENSAAVVIASLHHDDVA